MAVKVIGLGAGGHARVVIEILRCDGMYELAGLLDANTTLHGSSVLGVPVLGDDGLVPALKRDGIDRFFVGVGSIGGYEPRRYLYDLAREHGMKPVDAVHPQAVISPSAEYRAGVTIMAGAVINACARLGENVIVNTNAVVEHDCVIADHVHIAIGAQVAGAVRIDSGAHIGAGATVIECVHIGERGVVGAGAVVTGDVDPGLTVVGSPARPLERNGR